MDIIVVAILVWMLFPVVFLFLWIRSRGRLKKAEAEAETFRLRFAPVVSIENEVSRANAELRDLNEQIEQVRGSYRNKRKILEDIEGQVAIYNDQISFAELGMYEPHFEFSDSETYKRNIISLRERQKAMISAKSATLCPTDWTVDGSRSKGQTMVNRQIRLTMRAFNNECEAAIANARWNNVVAMEKRILNASKQINNANASMSLEINEGYISLKLEELNMTHEYRERLKMEKEERLELARAEREEKKLLAEAEAAEREERRYQAILEKARKEVGADEARIAELEAALAEARATSERARAMAEMTKPGYVYIISNIGSFGEDVVKIGLTRRLEPDDRVRELGDASVPFGFDTHAMIYSEEAPALEGALHKEFADRRINAANMRKEFFRVGLDEVEEAVERLSPNASFFKDREAQEWHETLARRKQALLIMQAASDRFPVEI